jgi:hypothetical protein
MIEITRGLQLIYLLGLLSPIVFIAGYSKGHKDGFKEGRWNGQHLAEKAKR